MNYLTGSSNTSVWTACGQRVPCPAQHQMRMSRRDHWREVQAVALTSNVRADGVRAFAGTCPCRSKRLA
eukprot:5967945-Alexandrium_andersonii.AAC.1